LAGLEIPWALQFAPDGRLFYTERRSGMISSVNLDDPRPTPKPFAAIQAVASGEGGLLGLALSPAFQSDHLVYVYHSYMTPANRIGNRIVRVQEIDGRGQNRTTILDGIPGGLFHDGGRLRFGPDGKLYATAGDAGGPPWAQDLTSLAGKILRLNPDGSIPSDNPFPNSPVYSYGHRNPQGIAWHPTTRWLYETEHGPSGDLGAFAHDEVNLIQAGKNYGWPLIIGDSNDPRYENPVLHTGNITWAPSGCSFYNGSNFPSWKDSLFVATLRGVHLHRLEFDENGQVRFHEALLENQFGRLRDVVQGRDGFLYFCTSNRDGRGRPTSEDDRILRIVKI
jgi:glucose/arabinose dehydrogenase